MYRTRLGTAFSFPSFCHFWPMNSLGSIARKYPASTRVSSSAIIHGLHSCCDITRKDPHLCGESPLADRDLFLPFAFFSLFGFRLLPEGDTERCVSDFPMSSACWRASALSAGAL